MELISLSPLWCLLILIPWGLSFRYSLVDAPLSRKVASFLLRVLGLVLLIVALCRPFAFQSNHDVHVVFLVDVSQSVDVGAVRSAVDQVSQGIEKLNRDDDWSLFAVADGVRKFDSPNQMTEWLESWKTAGTDDQFRSASKLGESILRVRNLFPAEKVKQLVLLSDGQDTSGSLDEALRQVASEKISVNFYTLSPLTEPEVAVVALTPSTTHAWHGEVVRMTVEVKSNRPNNGTLRMIHRGVVVQEQPVDLKPDVPNRFFFDVDMVTPGSSQWTAELVAKEDHFPLNNQRTCTLTVRGRPRVLLLHQNEQELRPLVRALQEQDFSIEVRGKFGVPDSIGELLEFDAVVLADLPATMMTQRQMQLMRQFVVDFGGGLAMLGSENSFGLGGYHKTPVEEVLPLVSRFEKEREKPSLAMVLVIDKSGSMDGLPIMLAREAAKAAVELLGARDQIGVVGFDSQPVVVSELRMAVEADQICSDIDSLAADGGTSMYPAMLVGREMLENTSAKIRHMICLSDGHTSDADHEGLVEEMVDSGITVSTVALGDADRQLLARIAEIGRGRYYETDDPTNVPQIFTSETMQASRSAIKEDLYGTVQTGDHPVLTGFRNADLPFTLGYVLTQAKPTAQVLLVTEEGDPLLAVGRFGLGSGIGWSSDLSERWGGEWLAWGDCGKFWGQVLRGMIRQRTHEGIQVTSQVSDDLWQLRIVKRDPAGMPQSGVDWELATLDEQGKTEIIPVAEAGLGAYQSTVAVENRSTLTLRLRDRDTDQIQVLHYNRPWPAEYNLSEKLPESIRALPPFSADEIRAEITPQQARVPIAHYFYFAALAAFLASNLIRRL